MRIRTTMNENLNLVEILKYCSEGTKLYSTIYGDVELVRVYLDDDTYPIEIKIGEDSDIVCITNNGRLFDDFQGECTLFPSKEQRDWSKFKIKKAKFDPRTLKPFDRVLVRDSYKGSWRCAFYSHKRESNERMYEYITTGSSLGNEYCIPYNEDTKHILGTNEEAPEFYIYWEN